MNRAISARIRPHLVSLKALSTRKAAAVEAQPSNRQHTRLPMQLKVALCCKNYMLRQPAVTANISAGGAFLYTDNYALDCDERICMEVETAPGKKVSLLGTVTWNNFYPVQAASTQQRGIGVRFQVTDDPKVKHWMQSLGLFATY